MPKFKYSFTGWWLNQPIWKNMLVQLDQFPKDGGEDLKNMTHSANGPWKKSLNFIFPTKYVILKSLKFSHWLSEMKPP